MELLHLLWLVEMGLGELLTPLWSITLMEILREWRGSVWVLDDFLVSQCFREDPNGLLVETVINQNIVMVWWVRI
jgi:hypothetical protein